jgi:hypothetical protein
MNDQSVFFEAGQRAFDAGKFIDENPYEEHTHQHKEWEKGFRESAVKYLERFI